MVAGSTLEKASFVELKHILSRLADTSANKEKTPGVIVGGWAVYAFNPYYGSIDIDIVVSGKMRKSLSHWLCTNRDFEELQTSEVGWQGVRKLGPGGKWIIADFGSRNEEYRFEGRTEQFNFSEVDGHTVTKTIDGQEVLVPERALLLLFKLKAAWDRGTRLKAGTSPDPDWEAGKRIKDFADVLALLDPQRGGNDISVSYLGEWFAKYPFLVGILDEAGRTQAAIDRYGHLRTTEARARVTQVIELTT